MSGSSEAIDQNESFQSLMDKRTRLTLKDGRILDGTLTCIDRQKNFVLYDATGMTREPPAFFVEPYLTYIVAGRLVQTVEILVNGLQEDDEYEAPQLLS